MAGWDGFSIAEIGINGCGKTYQMLKFADTLEKTRTTRGTLALLTDDEEEAFEDWTEITPEQIPGLVSGRFKIIVEDPDLVFWYLFHYPPHYWLIAVDDAGAILNTKNPYVAKFMKRRRQKRAHVIMNAHGFMDYPVEMVQNTSEIWLFRTTDGPDRLRTRIKDLKHFKRATEYVNNAGRYNKHYFIRYSLENPPSIPDPESI